MIPHSMRMGAAVNSSDQVVLTVNRLIRAIVWYTLPMLPGEASLRVRSRELAMVVTEGSVQDRRRDQSP